MSPALPGHVGSPAAPSERKPAAKRFAVLDVLRAAAVLLVIVYHVAPALSPAGYLGVDLFFVLSGFLITRGLLASVSGPLASEDGQSLSVRDYFISFYRKRVRRLFPAFAFMLLTVCTVSLAAPDDVRVRLGRQVLGAVTSTANWVQLATGTSYFDAGTPQLLKHMWSLAVEEQFYLIWPGVVLLAALGLAGRPRSVSILRRRLFRGTAVAAVASAIAMAWVFAATGDANQAYLNSFTHSTGLLLGAAVACLPLIQKGGFLARGAAAAAAVVVLVLCLVFLDEKNPAAELGGIALFSLATAVLVRVGTTGSLAQIPSGHAVLSPVRWVADRSYAMYLWHWPLVVLAEAWIPDRNGGDLEAGLLVARAAAVILPTLLLSEISYRAFEKPVLRGGFRAAWERSTTVWTRPLFIAACSLLLAATVAASLTAPAKTVQQEQLERLQAQSQALQNKPTPTPTPSASKTPGGKATAAPKSTDADTAESSGIDSAGVTFVGDSVTVAASPVIGELYPNSSIQASVGQQMWTANELIAQLKSQGRLGKTVVLALGTNGTFTQEQLQTVVDAAGPDHRFVLVTPYGTQPWIADASDQLRRFAKGHADRVRVAEWAEQAKNATDIAPDGVHPGPQGSRIWVREVTKAIKSF